MPRNCNVCVHPERHAIEDELVERKAFEAIARAHSVGRDSLRRHAREHLPELLKQAHVAAEQQRASDLLTQATDLQVETLAILEASKHHHLRHRTALAAIREIRGNIDLLRKIKETDELEERIIEVERLLDIEEGQRTR